VTLILILVLVFVLPVAWFASEFQSRKWLRISLGATSIALSYFVAWLVGSLSHLQYNADYGNASSLLIDTVMTNIEAGKKDELMQELRQLKVDYQPTYENRANYDELVKRFAERLKIEKPNDQPAK
jgi:hypothetical protein